VLKDTEETLTLKLTPEEQPFCKI